MVKRLMNYAGNIILVLLMVAVILSVITNFVGRGKKDYIPGIGPFKIMAVLSGSMKPTFNPGDAIIGRTINERLLKEGDIITYQQNGSLITHRIISITEKDGKKFFITKGDNNNVEDNDMLTQDRVVSRYLFRVPLLGFAIMYSKEKLAIISIFILVMIIMLSDFYKKTKQMGYLNKWNKS